eukprot:1066261-Pyramimonas_sp.AAC.1
MRLWRQRRRLRRKNVHLLPSQRAGRWRTSSPRSRRWRHETEIERQRTVLDEELNAAKASLDKGREDLVQAQELLCKAHVSEFEDPLNAMSAGLASAVVESTEGRAALEKLQQLQLEAQAAARAAEASQDDAGAAAQPP